MLKNFFFDLDGTLLRVSHLELKNSFFEIIDKSALIKKLGTADGFLDAFKAMHYGNGTRTNEETFLSVLEERSSMDRGEFTAELNELFDRDFDGMRADIGRRDDCLIDAVKLLREKNYQLVLATAPVFPIRATEKRIRWAGLDPADFAFITSAENTSRYKYDPLYYADILTKLGMNADESIMVGHCEKEDFTALRAGMQGYFLRGFDMGDSGECPSGTPAEFLEYVSSLPTVR